MVGLPALPCGAIVAALRAGGGLPEILVDAADGPRIHGPFVGPTVRAPTGPELESYLADAARWTAGLRARVDLDRVVGVLHDALADLLGGAVDTPAGHAPFTVRVFPPGTSSPWHTDNYRGNPGYARLRALTEDDGQLSWLVPLLPYEGGAIEFSEERSAIRPGPGELLLFDGSRTRHRVAETITERWTLGGFAARARAGGWLAWS